MFWKLLKFELNSAYRSFGLFYVILLVSAALIGIGTILPDGSFSVMSHLFLGMSTIFYSAMLIAINIITVVFIIQGYRKTMYKRNAYLTHTLPITTKQLMSVKILSAVLWVFATALVEFLSFLVILLFSGHMAEITNAIRIIPRSLATIDKGELFLALFMGVVLLVESITLLYFIVNFIYCSYVQRFRIMIAIIFIIVAETLESFFLSWFTNDIFISMLHLPALVINLAITAFYLVMIIIWFFGSVYLLKHKMEVE